MDLFDRVFLGLGYLIYEDVVLANGFDVSRYWGGGETLLSQVLMLLLLRSALLFNDDMGGRRKKRGVLMMIGSFVSALLDMRVHLQLGFGVLVLWYSG